MGVLSLKIVFIGSSLALLAGLGGLLMAFYDVYNFEEEILKEMEEFKIHANAAWKSMQLSSSSRSKRGYSYVQGGGGILLVKPAVQSIHIAPPMPPICPPGPQGLPGFPGLSGDRGMDGIPGSPGAPGVAQFYQERPGCIQCPMGMAGEPGRDGEMGFPGEDGSPGMPGPRGHPGNPGRPGLPGPDGSPGSPGNEGSPGNPGMHAERHLPGLPGPSGSPGSIGIAGHPGRPGESPPPGTPGIRGNPGMPGNRGMPGVDGQSGRPGRMGEVGPDSGYCKCPRREYITRDGGYRRRKIIKGIPTYRLFDGYRSPVEIPLTQVVSDEEWHTLNFKMTDEGTRILLEVDGIGREAKTKTKLPMVFSEDLKRVQIGADGKGKRFTGCIRRILFNNYSLPLLGFSNFSSSDLFSISAVGHITWSSSSSSSFSLSPSSIVIIAAALALLAVLILVYFVSRLYFKWKDRKEPAWKETKDINAITVRIPPKINSTTSTTRDSMANRRSTELSCFERAPTLPARRIRTVADVPLEIPRTSTPKIPYYQNEGYV